MAESAPLNATSKSLSLKNFFLDNPDEVQACVYNSAMLQQMLPVCYRDAADRLANLLAVDFYKRSNGGEAFAALDTLNAGLICGCSDINVCKVIPCRSKIRFSSVKKCSIPFKSVLFA